MIWKHWKSHWMKDGKAKTKANAAQGIREMVDIKKKRVTHSGLTDSQVVQNRLYLVERIPLDGEFVNYFCNFNMWKM